MAKIDVYTSEMSALSARLKSISSVIENAEQVTGKVQSNLDFQVAAKADIAGGLSRTRKQLRQQKEKVVKMADLTIASEAEFRNADGQMNKSTRNILGKIVTSVTGMIKGVKHFFIGVAISRYKSINSIFMPAGTTITVAGISELIRRLAQIINGTKESGKSTSAASGVIGAVDSGATSSGQTIASVVTPTPKPNVVNTGSSAQNAANAGMTYYDQSKGAEHWNTGVGYLSSACGICCTAMVASHFGVDLTPSDLITENRKHRENDVYFNTTSVKNKMKENGLTYHQITKKADSQQSKTDALEECLAKYQNDPEHNSPPIVQIHNGSSYDNHYVLVVGKGEAGNYIIVDPSGNTNGTTLKLTAEKGKTVNGGYESSIKNIYTYTKS